MSDETTTDTLTEIEGQAADYTPPEGWRVLQAGETIALGDRWVRLEDGQLFDARRIGETVRDGTFLRRIPEPEPQPVQIREGLWRTRGGDIRHVTPTPDGDSRAITYPWHDARCDQTWLSSGRYHTGHTESPLDLFDYLGPIQQPEPQAEPQAEPQHMLPNGWQVVPSNEPLRGGEPYHSGLNRYIRRIEQPEPEPQPEASPVLQQVMIEAQAETIERLNSENVELQIQVESFKGRLQEQTAKSAKRLEHVRELRSEVSYVQGLLGDERRRFTELETLTSDLRAVNAATERAINSAARDKADLQHRLDTVAAEWAVQAETIRGLQTQLEDVKAELSQVSKDRYALQIELDAAQQVPADSPELRQLRADLAEVTQDRDTYRHAHELLLNDVNATHQRTKAMTVETIAEWLEPIRLVDSPNLANETLQHLPQIMRSLVGLDTPEDVD